MSDFRPQRPTPKQLAARWTVVLLIVIAVGALAFSLMRALVNTVSERFAATSPSSTPTLSNSTPPRGELSACADSDISISVTLEGGPDYKVGDTPTVRAVISNSGSQTCLRDVGSRANEVYVVNADGYRVWSSNRCPVKPKARLVEMKPGSRYQLTVIWPGTRNPKKCGELAAAVKPGEFSVFVSNGSAVSEPAPLTLN